MECPPMECSSDILTHTPCLPNVSSSEHFTHVTFHTLYALHKIECPPIIVTCDLMSTLFLLDWDNVIHLNFPYPNKMPQDFTSSAVIWGRLGL